MAKTAAIFLAITSIFFATSCLDMDDNSITRTPELEMRELDETLLSLVEEGYDIDTTDLGIYYIMHEEGEGPLAQEGDTLGIEYSGYLLSGIVFDASEYHYQDAIWTFVFDATKLVSGFSDGISLMNKGTELDMIIPSDFAYGANGSGLIEPYSTILFSVKMHDLKPGTE